MPTPTMTVRPQAMHHQNRELYGLLESGLFELHWALAGVAEAAARADEEFQSQK